MAFKDLFVPKWRHSDPERRLQAVDAIDDDTILGRICLEDEDERIRLGAIKRIRAEKTLQEVFSSTSDQALKERIIPLLGDEHFLESVAKNDPRGGNRIKAVAQLRNPQSLLAIVLDDPSVGVREAALKRITSQEDLYTVVTKCDIGRVAESAVGRLEDQKLLAKVAGNEAGGSLSGKALSKIREAPTVVAILHREADAKRRSALVTALNRDEVLYKVAASDELQLDTRVTAARRLKTDEFVIRLVNDSNQPIEIRTAAISSVRGQPTLEKLAKTDPVAEIREAAQRRIGHPWSSLQIVSEREARILQERDHLAEAKNQPGLAQLVHQSNGLRFNILLLSKMPDEFVDGCLLDALGEDLSKEEPNLVSQLFKLLRHKGWAIVASPTRKPCPSCEGKGEIWVNLGSGNENDVDGPYQCSACGGTGQITDQAFICRKGDSHLTFKAPREL
jgi:hypothetical protein